jgi:hypothetical protein
MATTQPRNIVPLRDTVLAILSLVSKQGKTRVPLTEIYEIFADLAEKYPDRFPGLAFMRTPFTTYSKRLDDAIQDWVGYSIDVPNPTLQYVEIGSNAAERHLTWLRDRYGSEWLDSLNIVGTEFINKMESHVYS